MREIFDKQRQLNRKVFDKMGLQYDFIVSDIEAKQQWILNFRNAISAEFREFLDCAKTDERNAKIELIDVLHFLVSLAHLVGVSEDDACDALRQGPFISMPYNTVDKLALELFVTLDELQGSVKWKWWAKGGGFKDDVARRAVLQLWWLFWLLVLAAGMTFEDVKRIYIAKHAVNHQRQDQGYSEDTKTEADNESILV